MMNWRKVGIAALLGGLTVLGWHYGILDKTVAGVVLVALLPSIFGSFEKPIVSKETESAIIASVRSSLLGEQNGASITRSVSEPPNGRKGDGT